MAKTAAWQRKEGKNPKGGLNAKGRASYKAQTGGTLKPPVSAKQAAKSPRSAARRKSFCARMGKTPCSICNLVARNYSVETTIETFRTINNT